MASIIDTLPDDTPHAVIRAIDLLEKRGYTVISPKGSGDLVKEVANVRDRCIAIVERWLPPEGGYDHPCVEELRESSTPPCWSDGSCPQPIRCFLYGCERGPHSVLPARPHDERMG